MSASETTACPFCEAEIGARAKKCRYCGEWVSRSCEGCGTQLRGEWAARGICVECQKQRLVPMMQQVGAPGPVMVQGKSRGVAIASAFVLGGLGVHRFYLGRIGSGILYLLFFWTFIPALVAICEGVNFAVMGEEEFQRRYSR